MLICICYHLLPHLPCKGQQKGAVHAQPDNILVEFIVIFVLTTIWIELVVCCLQFSYYGEIIQRQNSAANHAASVVLLFRFSFLNVSRQQWGNLQRKVSALHHFPVLVSTYTSNSFFVTMQTVSCKSVFHVLKWYSQMSVPAHWLPAWSSLHQVAEDLCLLVLPTQASKAVQIVFLTSVGRTADKKSS